MAPGGILGQGQVWAPAGHTLKMSLDGSLSKKGVFSYLRPTPHPMTVQRSLLSACGLSETLTHSLGSLRLLL